MSTATIPARCMHVSPDGSSDPTNLQDTGDENEAAHAAASDDDAAIAAWVAEASAVLEAAFGAGAQPQPQPHASVDDAMRRAHSGDDPVRIPALEQLIQMADTGSAAAAPNAAIQRMLDQGVVPLIANYLSEAYDDNGPVQRNALKLLQRVADHCWTMDTKPRVPVALLQHLARHVFVADSSDLASLLHYVVAMADETEAYAEYQQWAAGNHGLLRSLVRFAADPATPLDAALRAVVTLFDASSHPDATLDVVTPVFPLLKRALKAPYAFSAAVCATDIGMALAKRLGGFGPDTLAADGIVDDIAAAIAANALADVEATGVAWRVLGRMCEASDAHKWLVARSGVLKELPATIAADDAAIVLDAQVRAMWFLKTLLAGRDPAMLRHVLQEAPNIVPAVLRGAADPNCRTRAHRRECFSAMRRAAGPKERGDLSVAEAAARRLDAVAGRPRRVWRG